MKQIFLNIFLLLILSGSPVLSLPEFEARKDLCTIGSKNLNEISGIAPSIRNPGIYWIHNDSDIDAYIYGITNSCRIACIIKIKNAPFTDWEDICTGQGPESSKSYIYIGDIGDNESKRDLKSIIRIEEPLVNLTIATDSLTVENPAILQFSYPDGNKDSETLMIDNITKDLVIVSKRLNHEKVYQFPYPQSENQSTILTYLCDLPFGYEGFGGSGVTAGDISQAGTEILLKTYSKVYYYKRDSGESILSALTKDPEQVKYSMEPQGEAICWDACGNAFLTISEESPFKIPPHLYFYQKMATDVSSVDIVVTDRVKYDRTSNCLEINNSDRFFNIFILYDTKGRELLRESLEPEIKRIYLNDTIVKGIYLYELANRDEKQDGKLIID